MNRITLFALLMTVGLVACGGDWSVGPDGNSSFNRRFHYYYGEDCRYDAFGQSYDCSDLYSLSTSMNVDLRITYDGYATLCVNNNCSYYDPGEYFEGYTLGNRYYEFSGDDVRMIIYTDGSELIYIDSYEGYAYYYYRDYDYYY